MRVVFSTTVIAILAATNLIACSSNSGGTPATNPPSSAQEAQNAATSGGSSSTSGAAANGSLNSIFGSTGGGSSPATIRSAQKTELQSEVDLLNNNLSVDIQLVSQLQGSLNSVQSKGIPSITSPTLAGSLVTGLGDFAAGAITSGGGSSSASGASGAAASGSSAKYVSNGSGGFSQDYGASQAYTAGIGAIGTGISSVITANQTSTDINAIGSSVQQQIGQLNSEIKDLYAQIAQKNSQIDALNVEGTN